MVLDVVGGDVFLDSLRLLAPQGRLLVVGFASGQGIPEVKVNRLLLNNTDVRGVGWGAYAMVRPGYMAEQWEALLPMIASGVVDPPIGATYDLDGGGAGPHRPRRASHPRKVDPPDPRLILTYARGMRLPPGAGARTPGARRHGSRWCAPCCS